MTPEAHARAETLLLRYLDTQQRDLYIEQGYFVETGRSGTRYYIKKHTGLYEPYNPEYSHSLVGVEDVNGARSHVLCTFQASPVGRLFAYSLPIQPEPDAMLTLALHIRSDERYFISRVNIFGVRQGGEWTLPSLHTTIYSTACSGHGARPDKTRVGWCLGVGEHAPPHPLWATHEQPPVRQKIGGSLLTRLLSHV